jgi:hypothetical protein
MHLTWNLCKHAVFCEMPMSSPSTKSSKQMRQVGQGLSSLLHADSGAAEASSFVSSNCKNFWWRQRQEVLSELCRITGSTLQTTCSHGSRTMVRKETATKSFLSWSIRSFGSATAPPCSGSPKLSFRRVDLSRRDKLAITGVRKWM